MSRIKQFVSILFAMAIGLLIGYIMFNNSGVAVADQVVAASVVDVSELVSSIEALEVKVDTLLECGCGAPVTDTEVVTFMVPVLREKSVIVEVCDSVTETVSITNTVVPSTSIIITTPVVTPVTVTPTPVTTTPTPTPTPTNTPTPTATSTEVPPTAVPTATPTTTPPTAVPTMAPTSEVPPTQTAVPTSVPTTVPTATVKPKCNQGLGNGPEGCDPGNSNNNHVSNDEGNNADGTKKTPGNGGRKNSDPLNK